MSQGSRTPPGADGRSADELIDPEELRREGLIARPSEAAGTPVEHDGTGRVRLHFTPSDR